MWYTYLLGLLAAHGRMLIWDSFFDLICVFFRSAVCFIDYLIKCSDLGWTIVLLHFICLYSWIWSRFDLAFVIWFWDVSSEHRCCSGFFAFSFQSGDVFYFWFRLIWGFRCLRRLAWPFLGLCCFWWAPFVCSPSISWGVLAGVWSMPDLSSGAGYRVIVWLELGALLFWFPLGRWMQDAGFHLEQCVGVAQLSCGSAAIWVPRLFQIWITFIGPMHWFCWFFSWLIPKWTLLLILLWVCHVGRFVSWWTLGTLDLCPDGFWPTCIWSCYGLFGCVFKS